MSRSDGFAAGLRRIAFLALGFGMLAPGAANGAAILTINDATTEGVITVTYSGFAAAACPGATSVTSTSCTYTEESASFAGEFINTDVPSEGPRTIWLLEGTTGNVISDQITYTLNHVGPTTVLNPALTFASDSETNNLGTLILAGRIRGTDYFYEGSDLTSCGSGCVQLTLSRGTTNPLTMNFQSDLDGTTVPEPGTLALLGLGLLPLARIARKRLGRA